MFASKRSEYALRAVTIINIFYIAGRNTRLADIMKTNTDMPRALVQKILNELVQKNILLSKNGPHGGFTFAKSPTTIFLSDIASLFEDTERFKQCVLGLPGCSDQQKCALHDQWKFIRDPFYRIMHDTPVSHLSANDTIRQILNITA